MRIQRTYKYPTAFVTFKGKNMPPPLAIKIQEKSKSLEGKKKKKIIRYVEGGGGECFIVRVQVEYFVKTQRQDRRMICLV